MIEHYAARTRALYTWEEYDLERRRGVRPLDSEREGRRVIDEFWSVKHCRPPRLHIRKIKGHPYCEGRCLIVLSPANHRNITLLHEITHAHGYGGVVNQHNQAFVRAYIALLAQFFKWDAGELTCQAIMRGLL